MDIRCILPPDFDWPEAIREMNAKAEPKMDPWAYQEMTSRRVLVDVELAEKHPAGTHPRVKAMSD
jgi:hypothetical protein